MFMHLNVIMNSLIKVHVSWTHPYIVRRQWLNQRESETSSNLSFRATTETSRINLCHALCRSGGTAYLITMGNSEPIYDYFMTSDNKRLICRKYAEKKGSFANVTSLWESFPYVYCWGSKVSCHIGSLRAGCDFTQSDQEQRCSKNNRIWSVNISVETMILIASILACREYNLM